MAEALQRPRRDLRYPHIRESWWIEGVPLQEVSLGYPSQRDLGRSICGYLREVGQSCNYVSNIERDRDVSMGGPQYAVM